MFQALSLAARRPLARGGGRNFEYGPSEGEDRDVHGEEILPSLAKARPPIAHGLAHSNRLLGALWRTAPVPHACAAAGVCAFI